MAGRWYYAVGQDRKGPISFEELQRLAQQRQLNADTFLFQEGTQQWVKAKDVPNLMPVEAVPPIPVAEATPASPPVAALADGASAETLPQGGGGMGIWTKLLDFFLPEGTTEAAEDARFSWGKSSTLTKVLILAMGGVFLVALIWMLFLQPSSSEGSSVWSRLWESGLVTGLVGLFFALLRNRLVAPTSASEGEQVESRIAPADPESLFLDLDARQWLAILVALFLPILLASLFSSFLVGPGVHLWVTGPLLVAVGVTLGILSQRNGIELGILVGWSALLFYLLTLCNVRWVLLLFGLLATLPTLHLFQIVRLQCPPFRFTAPLWVGVGILASIVFLGVMAAPRGTPETETVRIVGTWEKVGSYSSRKPTLTFTENGTVTRTSEYGSSEKIAQYTIDGKELVIDAGGFEGKGNFYVEFVSDTELLIGSDDFRTRKSPLLGRWRKAGSGESDEPKSKKSTPDYGLPEYLPPDARAMYEQASAALTEGDRLWKSGDKQQAVEKYTAVINSRTNFHLRSHLPRVYSRVIDYQAEQGDVGTARLLARRAADKDMVLTLTSAEAKRIYAEVGGR